MAKPNAPQAATTPKPINPQRYAESVYKQAALHTSRNLRYIEEDVEFLVV